MTQLPSHVPESKSKSSSPRSGLHKACFPISSMAAVSSVLISFLLCLSTFYLPVHSHTSSLPYLSPSILFQNYNKMLSDFKIYIYTPQEPFVFTEQSLSLFHNYLLNSQFVTSDPEEALLYYIPFPTDLSSRSIARVIKFIRGNHPYWNRTLGADHFFISTAGIEISSDRNIVELKKNSIQITIFPTTSGNFIPHKDVTLPPVNQSPLTLSHQQDNQTASIFCYIKCDGKTERNFVEQLAGDIDFVIESEPSDHLSRVENSKFCLFLYRGEMDWLVEAMAFGCVPVVLVDRPIQDMPLMDVLRWSDMALIIGINGGLEQLKTVLTEVPEDRYRKMRKLCVAASQHLVWNAEPQPHDAFFMVIYQLWLRRHTIRYTLRQ